MTGRAGADRRGLWVDDPVTGTRMRLGEVGGELAQQFAGRGDTRLAREVMAKPHFGFAFSKTF